MVVNLQSGHKIALQFNQREITPKISKAELWFLCMTHCLIVFYNCIKFHFYSFNGCQLTEWTQNSIANDQREITPKISKAELWFLFMTHRLIHDLYLCYNKKCKNIPAPLIIDPDVLLVLLQSLSVLMSFSQQKVYYLVRSLYVIKLVLKIIICRHRKLLKSLRQINF